MNLLKDLERLQVARSVHVVTSRLVATERVIVTRRNSVTTRNGKSLTPIITTSLRIAWKGWASATFLA